MRSGVVCQAMQTFTSLLALPIQVNFPGSKRAFAFPTSGSTVMLLVMIPNTVPSRGAWL